MALNNNLNGVLNNIIKDVAPVIKLSNGLYTLVDKETIVPDKTQLINLIGDVMLDCSTEDEIISAFKLLGSWASDYYYNQNTNTWTFVPK